MGQQTAEFHRIASGYRAILPGRLLNKAKLETVTVPCDDGTNINLTDIEWHYPVAMTGGYVDIKKVDFKNDTRYSVFYVCGEGGDFVHTKYLAALPLPVTP